VDDRHQLFPQVFQAGHLERVDHRQPLGGEYWGDTRVELPRELGGRFTNVLTGERLATAPADEAPGLPLADILAAFPVALLEREADA